MEHKISVVIPTFNRTERLSRVLDHLLQSDTNCFSRIEIIVVDDGSTESPESMIMEKTVTAPFTLKYVRQDNGGPARARNTGYRKASADIVLFLDDDVLVPPFLLRQHVEAHLDNPASVICGSCPCIAAEVSIPSSRYVLMLENTPNYEHSDDKYFEIKTVISGNLSIERKMFLDQNGLYDDNLNSPTAEEFDVIAKLRRRGIPVYLGKEILAKHLQSTTIEETCKREYKHAIGIGELAVKLPELAVELPEIERFLEVNGDVNRDDPLRVRLKKRFKGMLSGERIRGWILHAVRLTERVLPFDAVMFPLFKTVIGIYIYAGVRDGKTRFQK